MLREILCLKEASVHFVQSFPSPSPPVLPLHGTLVLLLKNERYAEIPSCDFSSPASRV